MNDTQLRAEIKEAARAYLMTDSIDELVNVALRFAKEAVEEGLKEAEARIHHLMAIRDPQPAIETLAKNLNRVVAERDALREELRRTKE